MWHAFLEDDEDGNVCIHLEDDDSPGVRELFGQVAVEDAEDEELNNENELLEEAEQEVKRRNGDEGD
ncbi:hypothetical protein SAMN05421875_11611 [Acidovorax soli]|uniref:Uncharacterized protein n=2 Tax=Acidovorax soli TaxID=592050 RepID=A0A1H4BVJ4_9BURK|nr:hypothetical protein SAMN05421875_11611 [Acidovorax soli]